MRNKKVLTAILFTLICSAAIFAGGEMEEEPKAGAEEAASGTAETQKGMDSPAWLVENTDDHITVIDNSGNTVTIQKPVTSLITNGMGAVYAAVKALKAEDMVVASTEYVTRNAAFFPVISKLPTVSKGDSSVDNEMIITLSPSFIISSPFTAPQISDAVKEEIPTLLLNEISTDNLYLLGMVMGKEAEAKELVDWIESYTDVIDERIGAISEEEYSEVFFYYGGQYGMSPPPPYGTFGSGNYSRNKLITRAGGKSLTEDIQGEWITVDPEWIIGANPSLIIRETYIINDHPELGYGVSGDADARALMESILHNQTAFEGCDAVKTGDVHLIYGDLVTDSWFISLVYLAKWLHPGLFNDINAEQMHQEYITRFQRLDYDVTTQGLFTYSANEG